MRPSSHDEWKVIEELLPARWKAAARECKAFQRARYLMDPAPLLRLLLFHAVNDGGLRETVAHARASGIAGMSQVALLKRLRSAGRGWPGSEQSCADRRATICTCPTDCARARWTAPRFRGPASKGTEWRIHYSLDLMSPSCDWYELTDSHGGELLERTPMQAGDVLLADRNYLRPAGVRAAARVGAHVLVRLRWSHPRMHDSRGCQFRALEHAKRLKVGRAGEWPVELLDPQAQPVAGRVVAIKLPAPVADKAQRRVLKTLSKNAGRPTRAPCRRPTS